MKKCFVVSDIHGMYNEFVDLLEHWDRDDKLVILGDMIDRGPDSLKVVQLIMKLQNEHDVVVIKGNHDQILVDFINSPNEEGFIWKQNGGNNTITSFTGRQDVLYQSFEGQAMELTINAPDVCNFLMDLPSHYIWNNVLFTHAGFASWLDNWEDTSENQFIWVRDHYRHKNKSGFVNVFGHTPTMYINRDKSINIWTSNDNMYIGIDGACAYGGQLNGLLINELGEVVETYGVFSKIGAI